MAGNSINYSIKVSAEASQAQKTIEQLSQSLNRLQTVSSQQFKINIDYREAAAQAEKLQAALQKAVNVNTGQLDFRQLTSGLQAANTNVQTLMSSFEKAGASGRQAMQQLQQAMTQAVVPAQKATGIMAQFGTTLMNTFKWQAASQMIHGMQSAISNAVSYIENLNKSLTDIRIVTGKSVSDMTQFTKQANQMARTLSTSTKSYADAALIYYQQGDNDTQAAQKAAITLKATNAAFKANAQEMSEMLTAVWNSYKAGGAQLEQYVDVMAKLGSTTATSMEEIATSLQKVAATANTVGVSMNQMSSIVATVSSVTREGAESIGTAYKTILARMGDLKMGKTLEDGIGLGTVSSSLKTIGVNLLDATGQMRDMGSVITDLGTKWQTMNTAQKTALAQVVAGKRQYTQLMALFENWDDYQKNMANAENSKGSLNKMQQTYESSVEAAKKRLQASKEDLFGTLINDQALITFNNTLSKTVDMVNNVVKGLGGLPGILAAVGSAMMTAFKPQMLDKLSSTFTNIGQAFAHPLRTLGIGRNTYGSYESLIKTGGSFNANTIARGDQLAGFKLRGGENALYNSLITSRMYNERQMAQMMQNQQYNQLQPEQQAMYQSLLAGRNATILKQQSMLQNGRISTSQMQALQQQINGYSDRSSQLYDLSGQMHNAYADQVQGTSAVTLRDYIANNNNAVLTNRDYARAATAGRNAGNLTGSQDLRTISQMYQAFTHGNTTDQNNALTNLANFIVNNQSKVQDYNNLVSGLNSSTFQSITSGTQLRDLLSQEAEKAGTIKLDDILGDDWAKKCVTTQDAQALLSSFQNQIKQAAQQTSNQAAGATALGNMLFGPQGMQNLQNLGNQKGNLLSQLRAIMAGEDPSKQGPKTTFADSLAKGITNVGTAALKASQGMNQMQQMIAQLKEGDTAGKIASVTTAVGSLVTTFATQGLWAGAGQMIGMGVQFLISKVEESAQKTREAQLKQAQYANELQQKSEEQNKKIQDNYSKWQSLNQQYEAGEISFSSYQSAIQAVTDALGMQSDTVRNLIGDYAGLNAAMEEAFNSQLSEAATTASMALTARQSGWANQGVKWITDNQNTGLTIEQRKASEIITQAGNYFNRIDNNGQVTDRDRVLVQAGIDRNASVLRFKDLRDQFMDSAVSTVSQTFLKDFLGGTENGIYSGDLATIGDTWDTAVNDDIIFTSLDSINTAYERLQTLQQLGEAGFNEKYGAGSINADQTTSVLNWLKTKEGQNFFSFLADMSNGYSDVKSTAQLTAGRVAIQSQKNSWLSAENLAAHSDTDIYGWLLDQVLSTIYTDHANGEYTDKERAIGKQLVNELVQSTSAGAQQQIRDSQTRATIQQSIADLNPDLNKKATDEIIQRTGLTNADLRYTDVNLLDVTNADTLYRSLLASTNARENRSNASIRVNANGNRLRQEASDDFKYSDWLSNTIGLLYEGDQLKSAQDILKYGSNADIAELYNKIIAEEFNEDKINQHIAQAMADNQQLLDMATGAALSHVTQSSLKSYLESNADEQGNIGAAAEHLQQVVGLYNQYWGAEGFDATQQIGDAATLLWKQLNDVFDPEQLTNVNIDELATMTWKDALESLSNVFDENIITNLSTPESVKQLALVLQILSQYTQLGVDISSSTLTDVEQAQLNRKKAIQNIKALSTINTDVASWSAEDIGKYTQLFGKSYAELLQTSTKEINELALAAMIKQRDELVANGGSKNDIALADKQITDTKRTVQSAQLDMDTAILARQREEWETTATAAETARNALSTFLESANQPMSFSAIEMLRQNLEQAGMAAQQVEEIINKLTDKNTTDRQKIDLAATTAGNMALAELSTKLEEAKLYDLDGENTKVTSWVDQLQQAVPEISTTLTVTDIVWGSEDVLSRLQTIGDSVYLTNVDGTLSKIENLFENKETHTIQYKLDLVDQNGKSSGSLALDVDKLFTGVKPVKDAEGNTTYQYDLQYSLVPVNSADFAAATEQLTSITKLLPEADSAGARHWNLALNTEFNQLSTDDQTLLEDTIGKFNDYDKETKTLKLQADIQANEKDVTNAEKAVALLEKLKNGETVGLAQDGNGNTIGFTFTMDVNGEDAESFLSLWDLAETLESGKKANQIPLDITLKTKVTDAEGKETTIFNWLDKISEEVPEGQEAQPVGTVSLTIAPSKSVEDVEGEYKELNGSLNVTVTPKDEQNLLGKVGTTVGEVSVTVTPTDPKLLQQANSGENPDIQVDVEAKGETDLLTVQSGDYDTTHTLTIDIQPSDSPLWALLEGALLNAPNATDPGTNRHHSLHHGKEQDRAAAAAAEEEAARLAAEQAAAEEAARLAAEQEAAEAEAARKEAAHQQATQKAIAISDAKMEEDEKAYKALQRQKELEKRAAELAAIDAATAAATEELEAQREQAIEEAQLNAANNEPKLTTAQMLLRDSWDKIRTQRESDPEAYESSKNGIYNALVNSDNPYETALGMLSLFSNDSETATNLSSTLGMRNLWNQYFDNLVDFGQYKLPYGSHDQWVEQSNATIAQINEDYDRRLTELENAQTEQKFSHLGANEQAFLDVYELVHAKHGTSATDLIRQLVPSQWADYADANGALLSDNFYDLEEEEFNKQLISGLKNGSITLVLDEQDSEGFAENAAKALQEELFHPGSEAYGTVLEQANIGAISKWNTEFSADRWNSRISNLQAMYDTTFSDDLLEQANTYAEFLSSMNDLITNSDTESLTNEVVPQLNTILNEALTLMQSDNQAYIQLGQYLIEGLCQGLLNADLSGLDVSIANIGDMVWQAFCNALGIHSPSTLTMGLGIYLLQGLQIGLENAVGSFNPKFTGVAGKITEGLKNEITAGISGALEGLEGQSLDLSHLGIEIHPETLMTEAGWNRLDKQYGNALDNLYTKYLEPTIFNEQDVDDYVAKALKEAGGDKIPKTAQQYVEQQARNFAKSKQGTVDFDAAFEQYMKDEKHKYARSAVERASAGNSKIPESVKTHIYNAALQSFDTPTVRKQLRHDLEQAQLHHIDPEGKKDFTKLSQQVFGAAVQQQREWLDTGWMDDEQFKDNPLARATFKELRDRAINALGLKADKASSLTDEQVVQVISTIGTEYNKAMTSIQNSTATTLASLKDQWTSMIQSIVELEANAAQQTYEAWVSAFQAIAEARQAILGGSIIGDEIKDLEKLTEIAQALMGHGMTGEEAYNYMMNPQNADAINALWMNNSGAQDWRKSPDYAPFFNEDGSFNDDLTYGDYIKARQEQYAALDKETVRTWLQQMYKNAMGLENADAKKIQLAALAEALGNGVSVSETGGYLLDQKGNIIKDLTSFPGVSQEWSRIAQDYEFGTRWSAAEFERNKAGAVGRAVSEGSMRKNTEAETMLAALNASQADLQAVSNFKQKVKEIDSNGMTQLQKIAKKWGLGEVPTGDSSKLAAWLDTARGKISSNMTQMSLDGQIVLGMLTNGYFSGNTHADGWKLDFANGHIIPTKQRAATSEELASMQANNGASTVNFEGQDYMLISEAERRALGKEGYAFNRLDTKLFDDARMTALKEAIQTTHPEYNEAMLTDAIANGLFTVVKDEQTALAVEDLLTGTVLDDFINALTQKQEQDAMDASKRAGYDNIEDAMNEAKQRVQFYNPENAEALLNPENWDELPEQEQWANLVAGSKAKDQAIADLTKARDSGALKTIANEDGKATQADMYQAYTDLAGIINSFFNVENMADAAWAKEHLPDIEAWANGSTEAMERLELAMLKTAMAKHGLDPEGMADDLAMLNSIGNGLKFGDYLSEDQVAWFNDFWNRNPNLDANAMREFGRMAGIELDIRDSADELAKSLDDAKSEMKDTAENTEETADQAEDAADQLDDAADAAEDLAKNTNKAADATSKAKSQAGQLADKLNTSAEGSEEMKTTATQLAKTLMDSNTSSADLAEAWNSIAGNKGAIQQVCRAMGEIDPEAANAFVDSLASAAEEAGGFEKPEGWDEMDLEAKVEMVPEMSGLEGLNLDRQATVTYTADISGAEVTVNEVPLTGSVSNSGAGTFTYSGPEGEKEGSWSYASNMEISGSYPEITNGGGGGGDGGGEGDGNGAAESTQLGFSVKSPTGNNTSNTSGNTGNTGNTGNNTTTDGGGGKQPGESIVGGQSLSGGAEAPNAPQEGGGGGGGGGKKKKKGKSKADIERYHEIDQDLKRYEETLEQISKKEDMAFGVTKVKLMREELAKMNKQMDRYQEKLNEAAAYLTKDQSNVEGLAKQLGITLSFNEDGTIENWEALQEKMIDWYNAHKDEEAESGMEGPDDVYERMKKVVEDYEDSWEKLREQQTKILELQHEMSEKVADIVEETHQWKIELADVELETLEGKLDRIEEIFSNMGARGGILAEALFGPDGAGLDGSSFVKLNEEMQKLNELQAAFNAGQIDGATMAERGQEIIGNLDSDMTDIFDKGQEIQALFEDLWSSYDDELSKNTDLLEKNIQALQTIKDISDLIGAHKTFAQTRANLTEQYNQTKALADIYKDVYDTILAQKELFDEKILNAQGLHNLDAQQQADYKDLLARLQETQNEYYDSLTTMADLAKERWEADVEEMGTALDHALAMGENTLDYLQTKYDRDIEVQERYLNTAHELYNINKLNRQIEQSLATVIDKSLHDQYEELQNVINAKSKAGQLTQYDVDMMQKQYELLEKQAALRDAQNAKDTVRLTRDENGNYMYQYTADQEKVDKATQEYNDVLIQINELSLNRVQELESQMLEKRRWYVEQAKAIALDDLLNEEEKAAKLRELHAMAQQDDKYFVDQMKQAYSDLSINNEACVSNYGSAIDAAFNDPSEGINPTIRAAIELQDSMATSLKDQIDWLLPKLKEFSDALDTSLYRTGLADMTNFDEIIGSTTALAVSEVGILNEELANEAAQVDAVTDAWYRQKQVISDIFATIEAANTKNLELLWQIGGTEGDIATPNATGFIQYRLVPVQSNIVGYTNGMVAGSNGTAAPSTYNRNANNNTSSQWQSKINEAKALAMKYNSKLSGYAAGGLVDYTGPAWVDGTPNKPELMLNAADTPNLLNTIDMLHSIDTSAVQNLLGFISGLASAMSSSGISANGASIFSGLGGLEQNVHISAEFPNATDRNEIIAAFDELNNRASQYINNYR